MAMNRKIVHLRSDAAVLQLFHECRPTDAELRKVDKHDVEVPTVLRGNTRNRLKDGRKRCEQAVINGSNLDTSAMKAIELLKLTNPERTQDIRLAIVPA